MMHLRGWTVSALLVVALNGAAEGVNLILSSATQSNLEDCGCAGLADGGIEPRAAYFDSVRQEATPAIFIDLGAFVPEIKKGDKNDPKIDRAIGQTYVQAMKKLGYDLVGFGPVDLRSYEYMKTLHEASGLPFVATNLKTARDTFWTASLVKEVSGIRIGFVAVPGLQGGMRFSNGDLQLTDPYTAVGAEVQKLRAEQRADAVILLAHEPPPRILPWIEAYKGPKIDLVVTVEYGIDVLKGGLSLIINAPGKGRTLGKAGLQVEKGAGLSRVTFERVPVDPETYTHEEMRTFLTEKYEEMIRDQGLSFEGPFALRNLAEEQDAANAYAGADACLVCHETEYRQWSQTRHSVAFNTLLKDNRHWVPECVTCHVTGYGSASGFQYYPESAALRHVQCETCHGPGKNHIEKDGAGFIRLSAPKELCVQCHDAKNSPDFDKLFDLYYKKIKHEKPKP